MSTWNTAGPDTVHLTFKEGPQRNPVELCQLLGEFHQMHDLPTKPVIRDRGVQGFAAAAIDQSAGLRMDWTRPSETGNNPGYFCIQIGGKWFEQADGETAADFLQLLQAYGPLRATRIDFQQTTRTKDHLTPWWIEQFNSGVFRVIGRKHFEPRGSKTADGEYPNGATLYHGSRRSERFARQYDKHLQAGYGPARRRDEIEAKGQTARDLWTDMQEQLLNCEQLGTSRGVTLHSFSKGAVRALLPIRDTSPWKGQELPAKWTVTAKEPSAWSTLFDEDPIAVKPREKRVSDLLKSYRYATQNFGAAISVMTIQKRAEEIHTGCPERFSWEQAFIGVMSDFVSEANEERVRDFLSELPPSLALQGHEQWLQLKEQTIKNNEIQKNNRM